MGKFFFDPTMMRSDCKVVFLGAYAHHMINVLRFRYGDEAILCDGNCTDFAATVESIASNPKPVIEFILLSASPSKTEPPTPITLFQGLPKSDKMEIIIEKCIEIGVTEIVPVSTSRSLLKATSASKKMERYIRIAQSAASQSMRGIIPKILSPVGFMEALDYDNAEMCLVAYEKEYKRNIPSVIKSTSPTPVSIWVGPEGGFDDDEINILIEKRKAIPISLGPRILRTETAGIVAISQILCFWEHHNDIF